MSSLQKWYHRGESKTWTKENGIQNLHLSFKMAFFRKELSSSQNQNLVREKYQESKRLQTCNFT